MTTSKIRVLSDHTINKMAAGEVIENPSSVVKELVENSIDAGAASICIEIQEGGRQLIRITDDGSGMSSDDALLCLERHATSKIREVEDIQDVFTMGFRGEAIPSISAISKFTLLTAPRVEEDKNGEGTLIVVEGGRFLSCKSAVRSPGTTIEVKSLFFNVPVRRKFQKSPTYDQQEIIRIIGLLALAYPNIQFEVISDQKSVLKTPPLLSDYPFQEMLKKRLESIFSEEYSSGMVPLNFQQGAYELQGYIGSPSSHKPNRKGQYLFINQRAVFSSIVSQAVREGYGTMLPTQRYPIFTLHLRLPGALLDVNVHPQKREVRLRQELELKEAIIQAVQAALRQGQAPLHPPLSQPIISPSAPPYWPSYAALLSPKSDEKWEFRSIPVSEESGKPAQDQMKGVIEQRSHFSVPPKPLVESKEDSLPLEAAPPSILATIFGYCLLEPFGVEPRLLGSAATKKEGGILLLDQRAAYSRIYYEKLLKRSASREVQQLLIPLTLNLSSVETGVIKEYTHALNEMGFGVREFGENTFLVDTYPLFLKENQLQNCLSEIIQDLIEMESSRRLQAQREESLALVACRASLPSDQRLSMGEASGLVRQLLACDLPSKCPMGKPICLYFSPDELAKWFLKGGTSR